LEILPMIIYLEMGMFPEEVFGFLFFGFCENDSF
jgi:hypothetical protein